MTDSPAKTLYALLMVQGLVSATDSAVSRELNAPDYFVTVYDVAGQDVARTMIDGSRVERPGFQVRVRSAHYPDGYDRAERIALALDAVLRTGGIHAVHRTSPVLYAGTDNPINMRRIFTINGVLSLGS